MDGWIDDVVDRRLEIAVLSVFREEFDELSSTDWTTIFVKYRREAIGCLLHSNAQQSVST